ncbi:MAG: GNAT family N-acetyltransferase [Polyangia bacterium]
MAITIDEVLEVTLEVVVAFERLLPQLSEAAPPLSTPDILEIVSSPGTTVMVARDSNQGIVGTVTLVSFRIPSGRRARIESLIVDRHARGLGVGRALCEAALERATRAGAESVDLTSSQSRKAANTLYQKMGFVLRTSNTYRLALPRTPYQK